MNSAAWLRLVELVLSDNRSIADRFFRVTSLIVLMTAATCDEITFAIHLPVLVLVQAAAAAFAFALKKLEVAPAGSRSGETARGATHAQH
jgi:hypothetical protein